MRRTTHLKAVAALSAVALLAACGGDEDGTADDTTTAAEQTDDAAGTDDMAGETGDDMAGETEGAGAGGDGNTGDTFTLGYILPETGQLAFLGPPQITALGLAISDINDAGGVLGNEVPDAIAGDEAGQDTVAQASADRILSQDVSAIVGAAASGMSLAVIDRITGAGVMQCSGSNTAPTFTDYEDDGLYIRTAPSDALQGPVLANTIVNDGWSNVAIVARADDYGRGLADATAEALENAGATVALNETYDPNATEFNAAVESVVSAEPDAVVVVAFEEGAQILQGLFEAGLTPESTGIYGADGLRSGDLGSIVNESDPTIIAGMKGTAPASADNPEFLDKLAEFDPELEDTTFAPQVYDCVVTMALAAEAAGSVNAMDFKESVNDVTQGGTECTSFEECRDLLADGEDIDYNGASGPLDFTEAGEPGRATIEVYEFDADGELQSVETVESNPTE
ncbi:ABC transporter substrate-binding protein [Ornithinimicrobium sediminis]|uniref:ABC transporter substrate-binding protein n=1 Tax=Ornithinimicrobium sediminis TaxID=2904603 RepID=UPI001E63298E|nr:ABC transporter substrate-binding protein [Ornithinimicrobium sediminis]MCE0487585.1 ABC transporter substrate-binding protein [Ornithinimicrobium sediminis]